MTIVYPSTGQVLVFIDAAATSPGVCTGNTPTGIALVVAEGAAAPSVAYAIDFSTDAALTPASAATAPTGANAAASPANAASDI